MNHQSIKSVFVMCDSPDVYSVIVRRSLDDSGVRVYEVNKRSGSLDSLKRLADLFTVTIDLYCFPTILYTRT